MGAINGDDGFRECELGCLGKKETKGEGVIYGKARIFSLFVFVLGSKHALTRLLLVEIGKTWMKDWLAANIHGLCVRAFFIARIRGNPSPRTINIHGL